MKVDGDTFEHGEDGYGPEAAHAGVEAEIDAVVEPNGSVTNELSQCSSRHASLEAMARLIPPATGGRSPCNDAQQCFEETGHGFITSHQTNIPSSAPSTTQPST